MGKSLNNKYGQKRLDSAKKSTADAIKTILKRAIQKTAEVTGDKISDKITSVSKKSGKELQNNEAEVDVERATPNKRYVSPEVRQQIIDELRLVMEYQKIENLLDNEVALSASNKPSKFRTRNWVEINDNIRGAYSPNKQIRFKTAMLRSSLCDYSDAYILVKGNISVHNTAAAGATANNTNKKVIFKKLCTIY